MCRLPVQGKGLLVGNPGAVVGQYFVGFYFRMAVFNAARRDARDRCATIGYWAGIRTRRRTLSMNAVRHSVIESEVTITMPDE